MSAIRLCRLETSAFARAIERQASGIGIEAALEPLPGADLWYLETATLLADERIAASCRRLLSDEERARQDRFVFASDRALYGLAHALVRLTLSRYARARPRDWRFAAGRQGKPFALPMEGGAAPRFSLTHTGGLAACLVAEAGAIGTDAEDLARGLGEETLARRYFAGPEIEDLERLEGPARRERFYAYWTLKEAYVKATGQGLGLALDSFAFRLAGDEIRIEFLQPPSAQGAARHPAAWNFRLFRPTATHLLAAALGPARAELS